MTEITSIDFVENELGQAFGRDLPNARQFTLDGADVRVIGAPNAPDKTITIVINPMAGRSLIIHLKQAK